MFCLTFESLVFPPPLTEWEQLLINYPVGHLPTLYLRPCQARVDP